MKRLRTHKGDTHCANCGGDDWYIWPKEPKPGQRTQRRCRDCWREYMKDYRTYQRKLTPPARTHSSESR